MSKKTTKELENILEKVHPDDMQQYISENIDELMDGKRSFMEYMNLKLKEKKLKKEDVFTRADISLGYGYKLLSEEKRTKRRDVILRICYAAEFTLEETQTALKLYRMNKLYARESRDAMLMVFFNEHPGSIIDINEMLKNEGMEPLRSSGAVD